MKSCSTPIAKSVVARCSMSNMGRVRAVGARYIDPKSWIMCATVAVDSGGGIASEAAPMPQVYSRAMPSEMQSIATVTLQMD